MPRKSDRLTHEFTLPTKARATSDNGYQSPAAPSANERQMPLEEKAAAFVGGRRSTKLRNAELGERVVAYVPPELAQALRVRCVEDRRSLSDAVTEAIRLLLEK